MRPAGWKNVWQRLVMHFPAWCYIPPSASSCLVGCLAGLSLFLHLHLCCLVLQPPPPSCCLALQSPPHPCCTPPPSLQPPLLVLPGAAAPPHPPPSDPLHPSSAPSPHPGPLTIPPPSPLPKADTPPPPVRCQPLLPQAHHWSRGPVGPHLTLAHGVPVLALSTPAHTKGSPGQGGTRTDGMRGRQDLFASEVAVSGLQFLCGGTATHKRTQQSTCNSAS
jgi:hypothetical protein